MMLAVISGESSCLNMSHKLEKYDSDMTAF